MNRKLIIAANWKMHKTCNDAEEFLVNIETLTNNVNFKVVDVMIFPTAVSLQTLCIMAQDTHIKIGAQNIYPGEQAARTGEISADIAKSTGIRHTLVGHSERRKYFNDDDETINLKIKSALKHGLKPMLCIGETLDERKVGKSEDVVTRQLKIGLHKIKKAVLKNIMIAYEPVWAISTSGTGIVATPDEAEEMHTMIRKVLASMYDRKTADAIPILYGGSVKPENAHDLLRKKDIDGALIGGAALFPKSFAEIIFTAERIMEGKD